MRGEQRRGEEQAVEEQGSEEKSRVGWRGVWSGRDKVESIRNISMILVDRQFLWDFM